MNKVAGSVWLDGVVSYTGITPRFSKFGIDIYRLIEKGSAQILETEGPHISLQAPALLVTNIPAETLAVGAKYDFSGPGVGSIWMLNGYPAADLGSESRRIEKYSLLLNIDSGSLNFNISGSTGPVIETTKHTGKIYTPSQDFRIEFSLPEESYESVFEHKQSADALRSLFARALHAANA
ncbi:MAG: hypothetical protein Q8K57_01255 [Thiobacillus sp.]|nr:hypothetical protein [Thiobacillus sp.]